MPGTVVGTSMNIGFPGSFSRNGDCIIANRPCKGSDIPFGAAVILNTDNTYSLFAADGTMAAFAGFAAREVKQTFNYVSADGVYKEGQPTDVIERGSITVVCAEGTPTAGGKVYIRVTANGAGKVVGNICAESDTDKTIEITNCRWSTGLIDANKVAEVTILTRNNP